MTARRRAAKRRRPEAVVAERARQADELESLRRENERLRQENAEQAKRITHLERQLALRSQNSTLTSKPPSSDGLAGCQRERGRRTKSRRKPGGQPGHLGHCRPLVPVERVSQIITVRPVVCRQCQHTLSAAAGEVGEPRRHQVTELPAIVPHITEYQCLALVCPACGETTQAPVPMEVEGQFGPQLTALIAYLTVVCRLPRLVVQRVLEGTLQISVSLGSTQKAWEEASAAVAGPYQELEHALPHQPVLNSDETGHRTNGEKRWLWAFVAATFIVYRITRSRGADVLREILGASFAGILGSDRLPTYLTYTVSQRQLCWAHYADLRIMPIRVIEMRSAAVLATARSA